MTILQGDCVARLSEDIGSDTIPLTVCSPPYDSLRDYSGAPWNFEALALELFRVTKPGGIVCWNVGDATVEGSETLTSFRQAIFFKDKCGFKVHDTMIWNKIHVAAPCATRYHQMFEYVFVLSKGKPNTFNPIHDRKNKWAGKEPFSYNSKRLVDGSIKRTREQADWGAILEYGRRTNVWEEKSAAQEQPCSTLPHPAMMPKWLAHDLIISFSNAGDTVLDPMCGSGTTGREAIGLGRDFIGIDIAPEYCELARESCRVTPGMVLA